MPLIAYTKNAVSTVETLVQEIAGTTAPVFTNSFSVAAISLPWDQPQHSLHANHIASCG